MKAQQKSGIAPLLSLAPFHALLISVPGLDAQLRLVAGITLPLTRAIQLLFQPGVQRIAQAIPKQVEAEDGDENRQAGEQGNPGIQLDEHHIRP